MLVVSSNSKPHEQKTKSYSHPQPYMTAHCSPQAGHSMMISCSVTAHSPAKPDRFPYATANRLQAPVSMDDNRSCTSTVRLGKTKELAETVIPQPFPGHLPVSRCRNTRTQRTRRARFAWPPWFRYISGKGLFAGYCSRRYNPVFSKQISGRWNPSWLPFPLSVE